MKAIKAKSYTLHTEEGNWLGQVVITEDGMFSAVTDWGNLSYAWRGDNGDFRAFLSSINVEYFAQKLVNGLSYILYGKQAEMKIRKFAEKILPPFQAILKAEIEAEIPLGWAGVPKEFKFRTVDRDGMVTYWDKEPVPAGDGHWVSKESPTKSMVRKSRFDWASTLEER